MSWMQLLCETYDNVQAKVGDYTDTAILLPMFHTTMTCNIEVLLNENGEFLQAAVFREGKKIIIPCTESSAGRAGQKPEAHPLSDKLQYVAGDFARYSGEVTIGFREKPEEPFCQLSAHLKAWSEAFPNNYKLHAVERYLRKECLIVNLVEAGILFASNGKLIKEWDKENKNSKPAIFESIKNVHEATIGWRVATSGEPDIPLWKDQEIWNAWIHYYRSTKTRSGLCLITGKSDKVLPDQHPKKILRGASNAKIISSNDEGGFTFLGRFITADEACSVSADASQKMHNALSWLIGRQGYSNGTQNIIAWAVSGKNIPDPMKGTDQFNDDVAYEYDDIGEDDDAGQAFAKSFSSAIAGYHAKLGPTEKIVVLAFDAVTSGRAALTYYRELTGSDFLERLKRWYSRHVWLYKNKSGDSFFRVRSPEQIAIDIYGNDADDSLINSVVQRLLPCIVDGLLIPFDLVVAACNQASRPMIFKNKKEKKEEVWENTLSTACALFRGYHYKKIQENYSMSLEANRTTRDYLYGRLLAVAEALEMKALKISNEKRSTTAERYMQQFAERPFSTWRTIELSLAPYMARLQSNAPGLKKWFKDKLDEIQCQFSPDDFTKNDSLSGEFLLGYHCQRQKLYERETDVSISEGQKKD